MKLPVSRAVLIPVLLISIASVASGAGADLEPRTALQDESTPAGLSAPAWRDIRAAYDANRHAAYPVDGGYQTRNPGQQWNTHFDRWGFETSPDTGVQHGGSPSWTWGLELVSYGRDRAERPLSVPAC